MRTNVPANVLSFRRDVQHRGPSPCDGRAPWSAAQATLATTSTWAFPMARAAPSLRLGASRSLAERAVVALSLMRTPLPGPPCYFVVPARSPSAASCASFSRMRHNSAAHTDAREAAHLLSSSQSRAGGRER